MLGGLSLRVDTSLLIASFGGTLGASSLDNDDARDWYDTISAFCTANIASNLPLSVSERYQSAEAEWLDSASPSNCLLLVSSLAND